MLTEGLAQGERQRLGLGLVVVRSASAAAEHDEKRRRWGRVGPATPPLPLWMMRAAGWFAGRRPTKPRREMSVEDEIERVRRDELVVAGVATTEPEAAVACGLLRSAGIWCASRVTNFGAGASDGLSVGGPHEILVRREDVELARQVLLTGG